MRIKKEHTLSIIVDIQDKLFPHIYANEKLLSNCLILLKGLKLLDIPIIVSEQYVKGLGSTISPLVEELEGFPVVEKLSFSCCDEPRFLIELNKQNKANIILFGVETHICVLQTAIDLKDQGYCPIIVENCTGSRKPEDKAIALERFRSEGITITTYESILLELCRAAGTEVFKSISKLIK